jgi:nucleotide-binding universal stress UspA family protein
VRVARAIRTIREPFGTLLVPTDFSRGSAAALDRAVTLPLATGARIDLVHVISEVSAKLRKRVEAAAREALDREVARARSLAPEHDITCRLLRGEPFVEIIRRARSIDADLIVVGRHGRRSVRDLFLGTTAARVLRMGEIPTLVVRDGSTSPYRKPLVATDLGDTSRRLVELAIRIAGGRATLNLVHAVHIPFEGFVAPTAVARKRLRRPAEDEATAKLARLLAPYGDHVRWKTQVRTGDARTIVVNEAIQSGADVIVVGTHGRSGLAHAVIGSVAEWVIANAPCDVLVARPIRFSFELP